MDSDVVKVFNKTLVSMQEAKNGNISKQKVVEITKAAMNAVRYFKHVVFILERYIAKCRQEFKIPALYVMDSILRQAKKQYKHKDVFAPRFTVNLSNTISNVLDCESSDRLKVVRIVNLWQAHQIFSEDAISPILRHCQASGLETNATLVERLVKGDKADMQLYQQTPGSAEKRSSGGFSTSAGTPNPVRLIPTTPTPSMRMSTSSFGSSGQQQSLDERLSKFSRQKLGIGRSNSINATPKTESGPKTPPLEDQDHRPSIGQISGSGGSFDEQQQQTSATGGAGLSRLECIHLLNSIGLVGFQLNSLEAAQAMLNARIQEQLEIESRRQGNIQNLLSRDFDYSDEEDEEDARNASKNNGGAATMGSPTLSNVPKEKLLNMAQTLLMDGAIQQEIRNLVTKVSLDGLQSPLKRQQQLPPPPITKFEMPDLSMPPPNYLAMGGGAGMFMQPIKTSPPPSLSRQQSRGVEEPPSSRDHHHRGGERRESKGSYNSRKRAKEITPEPRNSSSRHRRRSGDEERDYRRKRSRSRTPSTRSDRERERAAEKEKERKREQAERERRRIGLPGRVKSDHVLIASRTLWFGRIPPLTSEQDIIDAVGEAGTPERVTIVANRGCAYVQMPDRKSAFKIIDRMANKIQVQKKDVKLDWATINGIKEEPKLGDYWESKKGDEKGGYCLIPFSKLPDGTVDKLMEGAWLELDTLPAHLRDRYTNTGLKEQFSSGAGQSISNTTNFPQGIALPPMPAPASAAPGMPQLMPAMFNQATLGALQMQMAAGLMAGMSAAPAMSIPGQMAPLTTATTTTMTAGQPPPFPAAFFQAAAQMALPPPQHPLGAAMAAIQQQQQRSGGGGGGPSSATGGNGSGAGGFGNVGFAGFGGGQGAGGGGGGHHGGSSQFGERGGGGGFRGRGQGRGGGGSFDFGQDSNRNPFFAGGFRGSRGGGGFRFGGAGGGGDFHGGRGRGRGGSFSRFGGPPPPFFGATGPQHNSQQSESEGNDLSMKNGGGVIASAPNSHILAPPGVPSAAADVGEDAKNNNNNQMERNEPANLGAKALLALQPSEAESDAPPGVD